MESLTYLITAEPASREGFRLAPASLRDLPDSLWEDLAAQIAAEPGLLRCPAGVLAERYLEGHAELVLHQGRIIHYSSLAPVARPGKGGHSWLALAQALELDRTRLPSTAVYELGSGWTDRMWRGLGINQLLRRQLVDRHLGDDALGVSGMAGVAAPLDSGLGWRMLGWDACPYVTSLIGVPAADFPQAAASGWRPRAGLRTYRGANSPREDPAQRWEDLCICWGSDAALACRLDRELAALVGGDLRGWRAALVAAFEQPGSWHRLAFLP